MIKFDSYLEDVRAELTELLMASEGSVIRSEKTIQNFFEKHPICLLPIIADLPASYSIYGRVVISQPRFKSLQGDKQPDFLVVTSNSLNLFFNFIEIEDPGKKIFNNADLSVNRDFTQAHGQLLAWKSQNGREVEDYCNHLLKTVYSTNSEHGTLKKHHYTYTLVYGFAQQILDRTEIHNGFLQEYFRDPQLYHCTYSRIKNQLTFIKKLITVKIKDSKFVAIGMTPFLNYGFEDWYDYRKISGKTDLINQNPYLSSEDKTRLVSTIAKRDSMSEHEFNQDFFGPSPHKGLRIRTPSDDPD